jgi:hypothetical protein
MRRTEAACHTPYKIAYHQYCLGRRPDTDRVLMDEGQPQIYGTQYVGVQGGGIEPWPIADPATVDERRRAVGLPALAENTARLRAQHTHETARRDV